MKPLSAILLFTFALTLGCNQDTAKTRDDAAKATSQVKQEAKEASKEIKEGAEKAREQGKAISEGVRDGLKSDSKTPQKQK